MAKPPGRVAKKIGESGAKRRAKHAKMLGDGAQRRQRAGCLEYPKMGFGNWV